MKGLTLNQMQIQSQQLNQFSPRQKLQRQLLRPQQQLQPSLRPLLLPPQQLPQPLQRQTQVKIFNSEAF